ncbi:unnamed protein product, partial [Prorocentrum cordatum]
MATWLHEDAQHLPANYPEHLPLPRTPPPCHRSSRYLSFRKVVLLTKNSAPGRDGTPFKAWRKVADLAADVFEAVYPEMVAPAGLDRMRAEWASFNGSFMVFLPKKASYTLQGGTEVLSPSSLRPLSITNTDNRIFGSAVRLHIEPIRGFLSGRSIIANVMDVEEAMLDYAASQDRPMAVSLDFAAALLSMSQERSSSAVAQAWEDAVHKMHERARVRKRIGGGMFVTLTALRMYIFPLVGFLFQLGELPPTCKQEELRLVDALFPGARGWTPPALPQNLSGFGFSADMPNMEAAALGANLSGPLVGRCWFGGFRLRHRLHCVSTKQAHLQLPDRAVARHPWLSGNFFVNVQMAQQLLTGIAGAARSTVAEDVKPTLEEICRFLLFIVICDVGWIGGVFPFFLAVVSSGLNVFRRLGPVVPPRVWAAVLKAALGSWTCIAPSIRAAQCCFGCQAGQDSMQHCASCPVIARLAGSRLRVALAPAGDQLQDFLLMTSLYDTSRMALHPLRQYATFMATNAAWHGRATVASDVWVQAMTDAAGKDAPLRRIVAALWPGAWRLALAAALAAAAAPPPAAPAGPAAPAAAPEDGFKLIGYFDADTQGEMPVEVIPCRNLTHLVVRNAVKVDRTGQLHYRPASSTTDLAGLPLIQRLAALPLRLVVSLRGLGDDVALDELSENDTARENFALQAADHLLRWGAQGLEVEWHSEDPGGGKPASAPFDPMEQYHLALLCRDLSAVLKSGLARGGGWTLSSGPPKRRPCDKPRHRRARENCSVNRQILHDSLPPSGARSVATRLAMSWFGG